MASSAALIEALSKYRLIVLGRSPVRVSVRSCSRAILSSRSTLTSTPRERARSASNIAITATPNECAATDSTSRTPLNNHPIRGVDFSRINSARKLIRPPASGKCIYLLKIHGIEPTSNRASRLFSIPGYANGFGATRQPYVILAFIIRGLIYPAGAKSSPYALSSFIQDRRARTLAAARPLAYGGRDRFAFSQGREKMRRAGPDSHRIHQRRRSDARQFALSRDDALQT